MPEVWVLRQYQSLPLGAKISMTTARIREWYDHWNGNVFISFSGGKDSTVLAHLVRDLYPEVPMVFANTGLEYPEIQSFARKMGAEFIRPQMQFSEVISRYGYPIISKEVSETINWARAITKTGRMKYINHKRRELMGERKNPDGEESTYNKKKWFPLALDQQFKISNECCKIMKKRPFKEYQKKSEKYPYIGTLTEESKIREQVWIKNGCNAFEAKKKTSQPMSFWREQDVLQYIKENGLEIASVYGEILNVDKEGFIYEALPGCECKLKCTGCDRTGCIFCGFGAHLDKDETRFQRLAKTHPKQYE